MTTAETTTRPEHSPIGPSSYKRVKDCPGSMKLSMLVPPTTNDAAERGTKLHDLAATILQSGVPAGYASEADLEAVATYVEYCQEVGKQLPNILVEQHCEVEHPSKLLYGKSDFSAWGYFDKLKVVDYKSGRHAVEAVGNSQLLYYALGVWESLAPEARQSITDLELAIVQGDGIKVWETVPEELEAFKAELFETVELATSENPPFNPSKENCKWCPALAVCQPHKQWLEAESGIKADTLLAEPPFDVDRLEKHYGWMSHWLTYWKSVEETMQALAKKGQQFENYDAVDRLGNSSWVDAKKAEGFVEQAGLTTAFEKKLKSPTQVLKLVEKLAKEQATRSTIPQPTQSALELQHNLEALVERKVIGVKLVKKGTNNNEDQE